MQDAVRAYLQTALHAKANKGARVEQLIKSAGAELRYLPPYSPDMNPIEKAFSKLKAYLRKIAERTVAGLMRALSSNLPNTQFTSPPAAMLQLDRSLL